MFNADKTRMIGLPYGEKNYDNVLSHFHPIAERYGRMDGRTDRQTDGRTDRIAISILRISMLTCNKTLQHMDIESVRQNLFLIVVTTVC